MYVDYELLLLIRVNLILIDLIFIEEIADEHFLLEFHFGVLGLRVETELCRLDRAEFYEQCAAEAERLIEGLGLDHDLRTLV